MKRIITLHSNYEEFKVLGTDEEFDLMIEIMKEEIDKNTYYVCPSRHYQKKWLNKIGSNVLYIPHGLNKKRLECNEEKKELLKKYKLSEKIKILLPSRLELKQKRPELILKALNKMKEEEKNKFEVIFTGLDEQYKDNIKYLTKLSNKYMISSKFIQFSSINEAYKVCDIVLIPSKSESFGYSAQESLSLGIVTLLSNIPTLKEINKNSSSGIIYGKSPKSLSIKLEEILKNDNYYRKEVSKEWSKQYSLVIFANRYLNVFNER